MDLSKTKMDPCIEPSDSAVQPAPTATIAGSSGLETNQFFDITALIQEVHETRHYENNRSSFVVRMHDGSLDLDTQKVKAMPLTVYFDTAPSNAGPTSAGQPVSGESMKAFAEEQLMKAFAEEQLQSKTAVTFFCISGGRDEQGKFSLRSTRQTALAKGVAIQLTEPTGRRNSGF